MQSILHTGQTRASRMSPCSKVIGSGSIQSISEDLRKYGMEIAAGYSRRKTNGAFYSLTNPMP